MPLLFVHLQALLLKLDELLLLLGFFLFKQLDLNVFVEEAKATQFVFLRQVLELELVFEHVRFCRGIAR